MPHEFSDRNTVFVKGLAPKTHEGDVRQLLGSCPGIREVRLVRDFAGKLRGFGYVEFDDAEGMTAAEKLNGSKLLGRRLFIARSAPPGDRGGGGRGGSDNGGLGLVVHGGR